MGCASTASVTCQLYKLLLYEEGSFFKVCVCVHVALVVHMYVGVVHTCLYKS